MGRANTMRNRFSVDRSGELSQINDLVLESIDRQ